MNKKPKSITLLSSWKVMYCRCLDNPCQAVSPLNSSLFCCLSSLVYAVVFVYVVFCGIPISAHLWTHCVHNESFRHASDPTLKLHISSLKMGFSVLSVATFRRSAGTTASLIGNPSSARCGILMTSFMSQDYLAVFFFISRQWWNIEYSQRNIHTFTTVYDSDWLTHFE